nr:uncharacterized protein LOC106783448 isoform X3 [Equus caballus]
MFPATELSIRLKPRLLKTHLLRSYRNGGPGRALKNFTKLCTKDQRVSRKLLMEEARHLLLLLSWLHVQGQGTLPAPEEATSLWETLEMDPWIAQERQQWQVRVPVGEEGSMCPRRGCSTLTAGGLHQERGPSSSSPAPGHTEPALAALEVSRRRPGRAGPGGTWGGEEQGPHSLGSA